jgi:hypothetical protein
MKSNEETSKIPKTGRIGRFAKIVESKTSIEKFEKILENSQYYDKYKAEGKADWWKKAISKMESELGKDTAVEIMKTCGSKCCGQGQRKTAKKMMAESTSLKDFLERFINYGVKDGELGYEIIDENTIITKHNKCFCGQVKKSKALFNSDTYCQCSVEFNRMFFESAFEQPVEVKLKQSILNGGDFCEFEIKLKN